MIKNEINLIKFPIFFKVPVSLMDKLHAKCGICDTVISLNKKFEIVHLVRHFNAWHPTTHKCAGTWPKKVWFLKI